MFSLFHKHRSIRTLLPDGVDTHCHLLPGVDDGVPHADEALQLITAMKKLGLSGCICTPHISRRFPMNTPAVLRRAFCRFRQLVAAAHPDFTLQLSAEYEPDEHFISHIEQGEILPWLQPEMILVELSISRPLSGWADLLVELLHRGYIPVLAHPERYHRHLSEPDLLHLHRLGVRFQGNIGSLSGFYGRNAQERCRRLFAAGLYFRWGSDSHRLKAFRALPLRR